MITIHTDTREIVMGNGERIGLGSPESFRLLSDLLQGKEQESYSFAWRRDPA